MVPSKSAVADTRGATDGSGQFLTMANCDPKQFDLETLSAAKLNGRVIKHTLQTAQALALMAGEDLEMRHCSEVLSVGKLA